MTIALPHNLQSPPRPYKLLHETWDWPKRLWWYTHSYAAVLVILPLIFTGLAFFWIWSIWNPPASPSNETPSPQ